MKYTLLALALLLLAFSGAGQAFHNLDFSMACDTSQTGLCYWDLSWGGKGAVRPGTGEHAHTLLIEGAKENAVGFTEQSSTFSPAEQGSIITISADIVTENVEGKGAGLNLWLFDANGNSLTSKDMGGFYSVDWVTGTKPWKTYTVAIVCPQQTAKIKIGAILYGKGRAWFKNYRINTTTLANRQPSTLANNYITAACNIIKKHSLLRDSVDIGSLKKMALKIAGPAKTYSDCFLAVDYLLNSLRELGDEHSFFMRPDEKQNWRTNGSAVIKIHYPTYKVVQACGYILVPPFHGGNPAIMAAYADSLQAAIRTLAAQSIKGWIIDLRDNTGGNQEPMIAGLGPLFSAVKLGSLVDADNTSSAWNYGNGRYFGDDDSGWRVPHPVKLNAHLPIAVLTDGRTGSSGEIVTISFIGNANTRSFGQPTWGLTTGNGAFDLPGGAAMYLASTHMADRNGRIYKGQVTPDVEIKTSENSKEDAVLNAAITWLLQQSK